MFNERLIDTLKVTIFWLKRIAEKVNPSGDGDSGEHGVPTGWTAETASE